MKSTLLLAALLIVSFNITSCSSSAKKSTSTGDQRAPQGIEYR